MARICVHGHTPGVVANTALPGTTKPTIPAHASTWDFIGLPPPLNDTDPVRVFNPTPPRRICGHVSCRSTAAWPALVPWPCDGKAADVAVRALRDGGLNGVQITVRGRIKAQEAYNQLVHDARQTCTFIGGEFKSDTNSKGQERCFRPASSVKCNAYIYDTANVAIFFDEELTCGHAFVGPLL